MRLLLPLVLLWCWPLLAQNHTLQARDLFYQRDDGVEPSAVSPAASNPLPVTHRLGVRYNLLKVNPSTKESKPVDPDGNFARGDCIALEFSPNRDGHLYVFNLGSSGKWQLLLPSPQMPDEASFVKANASVRIPQESCFRIDDPPGVESLVVVITERQDDINRVQAAVRASSPSETRQQVAGLQAEFEDGRLRQIAGRDLIVEKLGAPVKAGEPPHSVYAVLTSLEPAARVVIQIRIRHE